MTLADAPAATCNRCHRPARLLRGWQHDEGDGLACDAPDVDTYTTHDGTTLYGAAARLAQRHEQTAGRLPIHHSEETP